MSTYTHKIWFLLIFFVSLGVIAFAPNSICYAQSSDDQTTSKLKGLTVSPLRKELNINPGTVVDGLLTVTNSSSKSMTVFLSAEEFNVIDQQYNYSFKELADITKWVSFYPTEFELKAGEAKEIMYSIGVPLSAEPGGEYISLFANTDDGSLGDGISLRQRIASLLYITVLGDVSRVGSLVSLKAPWLVGDNAIWNMSLQNNGTTHFRSRYSVKIFNLIGGDDVTSYKGEALVLPNTIRAVSDSLLLPQIPGIYRSVYSIGLGDTPSIEIVNYIIYMPSYLVVILVAIIIAGYLFFWNGRNKKQKTN